VAKLTPKIAFQRLLAIALRGHQTGNVCGGKLSAMRVPRGESPWTSADMVHQDALYEIQADLLALLLQMAESIDAAAVAHLTAAMPWAYRVTEVPSGGT
jgi:hypothetical protein